VRRIVLSLRHRNYQEYAADIGTKLNQFLEQQRDRVFEAVLWDAIMLFAFTLQDVEAKAKRHVPILQKVGIMLVALNDTLRGIYSFLPPKVRTSRHGARSGSKGKTRTAISNCC
jgi:hypothetical protein